MLESLRRLLLGPNPIPQYVVVGLEPDQTEITVQLENGGETTDVTRSHSVASLRPFTLALTLPEKTKLEIPKLVFRKENRILGTIALISKKEIQLDRHTIHLCHPRGHSNKTMGGFRIRMHYLELAYGNWRKRKSYNFRMVEKDLRALLTAYIAPRPVVLVSVKHEDTSNIFPMDLIGPTDSGHFLMALRSTSPAIELMKNSKKMALGGAPIKYTEQVNELGKHHKEKTIDWSDLPFETKDSPEFGLKMISEAVFTREVTVLEHHEVGSHILFVTRIENETEPKGKQMHHICGFYQDFLKRNCRAI